MLYYTIFIFINNLIKSNEIDVKLYKRYNILLEKLYCRLTLFYRLKFL